LSAIAPPISSDPLPIGSALQPDRAIGSFWRRLVAVVADGVIVGIAATVIALPFFEVFSRLGLWGRLVGFCMALPYFAILNSSIGNGQTLGKRWMHLQVVDVRGNTITFGKSLVRYALLAIPYFLNEISLPATRTPWIVSSLIAVVIFGVGGANIYLVCFNRHTRQGIHDLAVGSYVADADKIGPLKTRAIWKIHWVILGMLLVVVSSAAWILGSKVAKWGAFPQLLDDARLIENVEGVQQAGVEDSTNWNDGKKTNILVISISWAGKVADEEAFADRAAKRILQNDPKIEDHDLLRIVMIRGYDLGIAHARITHNFEHTPSAWKGRLFGTSPPEIPTATKP
jgi:uncharacterized RDD family membrane protein YckC